MNERIRQFERESHIDVYGLGLDRVKWEAALEKFAQLIATDCADLARDVGTDTDPEDWALDKCYEIEQKIRDRYGVEE